ncbi:hypothetical protein ACFOQM_20070 [Paenibacillus sp. GCM10012307]|uniref:Uncharacterized protein n=1 Tax=Paenibacillus roseus TaxID=2798579 RepID=A0A934JB08_9BACL|nr:hypothetical protein [Paenibacillus roseus]MBJ6363523.1 hypothetical protein [Paenibacillus roseus]
MKAWKQLGAAAIIAVTASLLLSGLPQADLAAGGTRQELAVFKAAQPNLLNYDNVIELLIGLDLQQKIKRVDLNRGVLAIDLAAARRSTAESLNRDMLELFRLCFIQKNNVDRLLIRVLDHQPQAGPGKAAVARELLVSADVRRSDEALAELLPLLNAGDLLEESWSKRLRLHFTPLWHERYDLPE